MRFVAVDWGTSRLRALLVEDDQVLARAASEDGISRLRAGEHAAAFERVCGPWLVVEPGLPVIMAGMVGSREGWFPAPYAACPAGAAEIAAGAIEVDLGSGRAGLIVPGVSDERDGGIDVMRGEETHLFGSGVRDGLICLPGTHCKWAEMRDGRIARFATFMTGEMHALLREHSMIGRPATEPSDPAGFALGLEAVTHAEGARSLLNHLFRARAATVTGRLAPAALGPYLSGLLTGDEVAGALRLFGTPTRVTIVADRPRADLYVEALGRRGIAADIVGQEPTLLAGLGRILAAR
ncbi:2-dehydro-3-deoxygalactonokinase [uncultured Enterovirga sp.]|uniref:2-dehydro-3-deoxygalactonokinase n=1 Tax=uncultured Enterovirga sp. TaxID=2026352 RepID=UPI0035CAA75F